MHKKHGEDIAIIAAFNELVMDLSSSKNVEKVLLAKSIKKSFAYDFLEPWLGTGLLISTGEKWFQRRKIITPTFHFSMLEGFLEVFNKEANILVSKLKAKAGKDEFDIYDYVTLYALDSICGKLKVCIGKVIVYNYCFYPFKKLQWEFKLTLKMIQTMNMRWQLNR